MRKEIYKIKNPKHIVFGDPLYFEDFKGAELKRLTVDYKPPKSFDAARLVLLEKSNEKYPEYTDRTMTLYLAPRQTIDCALPGFVDSKNEEKTERNAGYLVVSHSGGGMLRQGTRKCIRRTPANRGMRAHWVVKGLDISEDVCHGMCP